MEECNKLVSQSHYNGFIQSANPSAASGKVNTLFSVKNIKLFPKVTAYLKNKIIKKVNLGFFLIGFLSSSDLHRC